MMTIPNKSKLLSFLTQLSSPITVRHIGISHTSKHSKMSEIGFPIIPFLIWSHVFLQGPCNYSASQISSSDSLFPELLRQPRLSHHSSCWLHQSMVKPLSNSVLSRLVWGSYVAHGVFPWISSMSQNHFERYSAPLSVFKVVIELPHSSVTHNSNSLNLLSNCDLFLIKYTLQHLL